MDLILWRHAEAEDGEPDESRALTPKGLRQASRVAHWLDRNLPNSCRILASPTVRTVQTAKALGRKFKIQAELAPDTDPQRILAAINWPDGREPVLIVGHQPSLGQTAAFLLTGNAQDWTIRKGCVWWITHRQRDGSIETYLKTVMAPDLVAK
jgi:phosphohistidine phosphatase